MTEHGTGIEAHYQPVGRRWLARCVCGWSAGWFIQRAHAAAACTDHLIVVGVGARLTAVRP